MLYIKENGQLAKLESWDDVLSRPNFVAKLDIKDKELKEVIGFYKNEQPVICGIKSCRAIHRKGCIVRTADNVEICISHICGSNIFDERFEVLAQKIEEDVNTQIYKDVVLSQKNKVFEYWIKAAELTAGTNGLHKIAEKITSMKNPDIVGRYASTELVRMASSDQTKVTTVRYIDEKGITDSISEHEKQKIEHVVIGEIHNIDALSIDNTLGNLYLNEVEHVIFALENIDVNKISTRQLRNIGRRVSMLDKRIEVIRWRLEIAIKFLSKRNLMPMYNKMYQMDVVSKKDLGLYKAFIDAL